jgi:hypothetical protein
MSPQEKQKKINLQKERDAFEAKSSQDSKKAQEAQLDARRRHLQEQMALRQDYHSLKFCHWVIMLSLLVSLGFFLFVLAASYFPPTKDYVMNFIDFIL